MGSRWPFVGRADNVEAIRSTLSNGRGVVVAGDAGVGKSRLAAQAVTDGYGVIWARGTEAAATIPFGAFSHELPERPPDADGYTNLLQWAARSLRAAHNRELLVVVDDAHLLDAPSAALVYHLVRHEQVRVLATVRSGEPVRDAVLALWKDDLVARLDLKPLTRPETDELLVAVLDGPVHPGTRSRIWQTCQGNVLYLRELVLGALASGALTLVDGVWVWPGQLALSASLLELVQRRIGDVDSAERDVLELVAYGEPVGAQLLVNLTSEAAVRRVEDRGLVTAVRAGRRLDFRMAHPLYGHVVQERCGVLRNRDILRALAEATEETGGRRSEDMLRVAVWRLDSNTATRPDVLTAAGVIAWSRFDYELAARLLRAAIEAGGGALAAGPLGFILFHLGRSAEAVDLLQGLAGDVHTDQERTEYVRGLAMNLGCGMGRYEDACRVVDEIGSAVSDPGWRQSVLTTKAAVQFYAGWTQAALDTLAKVRPLGDGIAGRGVSEATTLEAWTYAFRADTRRCLDRVQEMMAAPETWRDNAGYIRPALVDARCNAHLFSGDLGGAETSCQEGLDLAGVWGGWEMALTGFTAYRAQAVRLRGDAAAALSQCRTLESRLSGWNPNLPRFLSELAHSAALLGDIDAAEMAITRARSRLGPGLGNWALAVEANAPWVFAAHGDLDAAIKALLIVAERADEHGLFGYEIFALHDVVRLGASALVADELARLATKVDSALATVCARHARAATEHNSEGLLAVSQEFERKAMMLYAAEASAQAAAAHRRRGSIHVARAAELRAWRLAQQCPGVQTPALLRLTAPDLTRRQMQVARLSAAGYTNRQIADRLNLSVRTVENHLASAYQKLGISNRAVLPRLLGTVVDRQEP